MKLVTKLVILGSVIAAAGTLVVVVVGRIRREHNRPRRVATSVDLGRPIEPYDPGDERGEEATVIATSAGIASVDPGPLAHPPGEGIALDPVAPAHPKAPDLRDRPARPGKAV